MRQDYSVQEKYLCTHAWKYELGFRTAIFRVYFPVGVNFLSFHSLIIWTFLRKKPARFQRTDFDSRANVFPVKQGDGGQMSLADCYVETWRKTRKMRACAPVSSFILLFSLFYIHTHWVIPSFEKLFIKIFYFLREAVFSTEPSCYGNGR